jgi:hypothetical protein
VTITQTYSFTWTKFFAGGSALGVTITGKAATPCGG